MTSEYNQQLAERLGADEFGMGRYVVAFLKAGPSRDRSEEDALALQRTHLDNIRRLADAGKLLVAGPFLDDGTPRGIYIFDVATVEEAEVPGRHTDCWILLVRVGPHVTACTHASFSTGEAE